ncbi:TylF/MycF/NovP-related O-methyltransferase [Sphingorhabdus sp.]|uniref:TylF/MycF/NovP-related O-methyltransferase n=1 Tax=Sphingorhabdus sp. TaxID=1902408 RepID=UPI0032B74A9C
MLNEIDQIIRECSSYTMIQAERFAENIRYLVDIQGNHSFPEGSIVECGVWKGGMALAMMRIFGAARNYSFFDSFDGMPSPTQRDGNDARYWASHPGHPRYFDNCRANLSDFQSVLQKLRPGHLQFQINKGWFAESLARLDAGPVAFAHLDCDWYDSTYTCLERLWPQMAVGGVILIDDYYDWEGCRRAVHDFLSRHEAREPIRSVGKFGGISITRLGDWTLAESPHLR